MAVRLTSEARFEASLSETSSLAEPRPKFAFLDGIRGVLALTVVLSHGTNQTVSFDAVAPDWMRLLQATGAFCVPGFIFLSGFCLTLPTIKHGFRLDGWAQFWERRANRILPAYYAALAAAILVAVYVTHSLSVSDVVGASVKPNILGPLLLIHDVYGSTPYDGPLWSLAPEVHIYFLFPLLLWLFRRFGPEKAVIGCVATACVAQHFCAALKFSSLSLYLYGIFAVGIFAAWHVGSHQQLPSEGGMRRLAASAALLFAALAVQVGYGRFWELLPTLSVLECLFLLPVFGLLFQQPDCGLRRFLECRSVQFLGRVSYSLYLTHWIVLSLALLLLPHSWPPDARCLTALLLGTPVSIAVAAAFYRLFEHPYLSRRRPASP